MARIRERELEEEDSAIPPLKVSFWGATYVMQPEKGLENLGRELSTMNINTLDKGNVERDDRKTRVGKEDKVQP